MVELKELKEKIGIEEQDLNHNIELAEYAKEQQAKYPLGSDEETKFNTKRIAALSKMVKLKAKLKKLKFELDNFISSPEKD